MNPNRWQRIANDYYYRDTVGGLLCDKLGQWYWFPYDFNLDRQGPFKTLAMAKTMAKVNANDYPLNRLATLG